MRKDRMARRPSRGTAVPPRYAALDVKRFDEDVTVATRRRFALCTTPSHNVREGSLEDLSRRLDASAAPGMPEALRWNESVIVANAITLTQSAILVALTLRHGARPRRAGPHAS